MILTPASIPSAMSAGNNANQLAAAASAAVAAQAMEENASAKVAMRDEVWRRRNWLRLACVRNQSWMAMAAAARRQRCRATAIRAANGDSNGERRRGAARSTRATAPSTASTLARITCRR